MNPELLNYVPAVSWWSGPIGLDVDTLWKGLAHNLCMLSFQQAFIVYETPRRRMSGCLVNSMTVVAWPNMVPRPNAAQVKHVLVGETSVAVRVIDAIVQVVVALAPSKERRLRRYRHTFITIGHVMRWVDAMACVTGEARKISTISSRTIRELRAYSAVLIRMRGCGAHGHP